MRFIRIGKCAPAAAKIQAGIGKDSHQFCIIFQGQKGFGRSIGEEILPGKLIQITFLGGHMSHQRHRSVGGIRIEGDGGHDLHIRHFLYANLFHVCVEGSIVDVAVNIEIHAFVLRDTGRCNREKKINQESSGEDRQ